MKDYFLSAALGCKEFKDPQSCQLLANLCVLNLYSDIATPCKLLSELTAKESSFANEFYLDEGYKKNLPWLYY